MAQSHHSIQDQLGSIRETVESVWIAIIMAFVLRAFIIEAFVIPTGSMAPRLMGQHWQFDCPACGYHYAYGVPSYANGQMVNTNVPVQNMYGSHSGPPAICPNCQYNLQFSSAWAYGGDRVLVMKYLYRFHEPQSWDVVVFKNPTDNEQNYIKRLIGVPGEMIQIVYGDIYYRRMEKDLNGDGVIDAQDFADPKSLASSPWRIMRKPQSVQDAMWQVIFENDYQPDQAVYQSATTERKSFVSPWSAGKESAAWNLTGQGNRVFAFAGSGTAQEVRFSDRPEYFVPNYAYNQHGGGSFDAKRDIISDLKLSCQFVPKAADASVSLHLSSFADHFRATLSADGGYKLEHGVEGSDGKSIAWDAQPWGFDRLNKPIDLGSTCEVALVHVDHSVQLWVDGEKRLDTAQTPQYPANIDQRLEQVRQGVPVPTVGIAAQGGACELRHVALMRDVFYTNANVVDAYNREANLKGWGTMGNPIVLRRFVNNPDLDEFFVLGDNSPASKDGRMWGNHASSIRADSFYPPGQSGYHDGTVPRYNMIGKAFFVYWPGGFRLGNLPVVPNVGRMRIIR